MVRLRGLNDRNNMVPVSCFNWQNMVAFIAAKTAAAPDEIGDGQRNLTSVSMQHLISRVCLEKKKAMNPC